MQVMNMTFIHDGTNWVVRDSALEVTAKDLTELDEKLREAIRTKYSPPEGTRLAVKMEFDYSTFPEWMLQYHPYYMHRYLEFAY